MTVPRSTPSRCRDGWSVEQAWEAISRGDKLDDRDPEPSWANVLVRDGKLVTDRQGHR
jgi:hypothetical protein